MDEKLWAGAQLKLQNAEFHLDMMGRSVQPLEPTMINVALQTSGEIGGTGWHRAFAYFDAFLSAARSVPEIIKCCFGVDLGHREVRKWYMNELPADERDRRHEFKKEFKPHYGFRELPLSTARNISEHRTGVARVTVTISGRFRVTYIGSATEPIPLSETRQIGDPDLALLLAKPHPLQPKWPDFEIEGQPLFHACQEYLNHARALIKEGRRIALQVHGTNRLSSPPTHIDWS